MRYFEVELPEVLQLLSLADSTASTLRYPGKSHIPASIMSSQPDESAGFSLAQDRDGMRGEPIRRSAQEQMSA